jgi:hypothetical protein
MLTGTQVRQLEPHVSEAIVGAIHFRGSPTSSDPRMLTKAYADLFTHKGGRLTGSTCAAGNQFATDSPLEGDGFELPVPREKKSRNLGIPLEFN